MRRIALKRMMAQIDESPEIRDLHNKIEKIDTSSVSQHGVRLWKGMMKSNLNLLFYSRQYTAENVKFVINSFLFLKDHQKSWLSIKIFTDAGFMLMNQMIEAFMLQNQEHDANTETQNFFDAMTCADLPILPIDLKLQRCIFSTDCFSPLDADFFDSYRAVSTTLVQGRCVGGHSFDEKTQGKIYMYLKCVNVPGLLINFESLISVTDEYEVILPPGLRFTWQKSASESELKTRIGEFANLEHNATFANGEYIIHGQQSDNDEEEEEKEEALREHHRIYNVSCLPKSCKRKICGS